MRRAAAPGQPEQIETFAYNANGQLAEAQNEHARLQWFYDAVGNLVREHQHYQGPFHPDRRTAVWHHHHNALNQRTGTTRPDGHRIEWLTYGARHVHGLLLDGQDLVSFERDALYRETGRTQANGLLQTMQYDPAGRLIEQRLGAVAQANQRDRSAHHDTYRPDVQVGMQAAILRRYRYDPSGQLTSLEDNRRGRVQYRYDPVGRLLAANSALGRETFAFDPAGNIQAAAATQHEPITARVPVPRLLDNLLKDYAGVSYSYDERGNVVKRTQDGMRSEYEWDAFNRMTRATTWDGVTTFAYDPLGRRIAKHSHAVEGNLLRKMARTMYGWDGDTLAWESSEGGGYTAQERTVHYVYERDSFVPLVQATRGRALRLAPTTDIKALMAGNAGKYELALDPLWNGEFEQEAEPFEKGEIAFYQCDLGTPQELTDSEGKVAWSAQYKAWGQARQAMSEAARKAGIRNPIRFQGQYFDDEIGLHYNRYRYYDPDGARYITADPIGLFGGMNAYQYAPSPTNWIDPLGLRPKSKKAACPVCSGTPCGGTKNPSRGAARFQNGKHYPNKDRWSNVILPKGTTVYTLYPYGPKPGGFFADESTLSSSKKSVNAYHEATQVGHSGKNSRLFPFGPRQQLQAFTLKEDLCVGKAYALANDQYGAGGGTQYYITARDRMSMEKRPIMELTIP